MAKMFRNLHKIIEESNNIIITTHIVPDADGIGSQIALKNTLKKMGKNVLCVNEEELSKRYRFLDPKREILGFERFTKTYKNFNEDLLIAVDTNKISRTGIKINQYFALCKNIIFIDHHPFDKANPHMHFIDTSAAATGQIIGEYIKFLKMDYDQQTAMALYIAILIDTNSFRYPSVTSHTHSLIADLLKTGITATGSYNAIYGTKKINHMHLLGHILKSCETNKNENIAWIFIHEKEFEDYGSELEETHAYINNLLVLDGILVACMFRERKGYLKVSLRSHGDIDVGEIANQLGGGGHAHSAATNIEIRDRSKKMIIEEVISKIELFLINSNGVAS
jgi:phosphoesterase RecJ-like protein